jgi:hypothetical protein
MRQATTKAGADDVSDAARHEADAYRGDNPRPLGGIWRFWASTASWWPWRRRWRQSPGARCLRGGGCKT